LRPPCGGKMWECEDVLAPCKPLGGARCIFQRSAERCRRHRRCDAPKVVSFVWRTPQGGRNATSPRKSVSGVDLSCVRPFGAGLVCAEHSSGGRRAGFRVSSRRLSLVCLLDVPHRAWLSLRGSRSVTSVKPRWPPGDFRCERRPASWAGARDRWRSNKPGFDT
jgi:hypothetical protein